MRVTKLTPEQLSRELERLERDHEMSSREFYERYQDGSLPESEEYLRWAWLCSLALRRGLLSVHRIPA